MTENRSDHPAGRKQKEGRSPSFEDAMVRLESIVHDLEEGRVGLADALARYEEGVGLLRHCHGLLERAERRIELLWGVDADGHPIVAPYDDAALTLEEKAAQRGRRRSAGESPGKPSSAGESPGRPSKSTRPSKSDPRAGQDAPEPPESSGPSLLDEGADRADASDLF